MSDDELIHSDFETIERENQNYRISTRVEYRVATQDYRCKATLFKSHNGRVQFPRRDRMHRSTSVTSDKSEIDGELSDCIDSCKEKLNEIEDAKDVSVEVTIDG
jgi:hypothetical protein